MRINRGKSINVYNIKNPDIDNNVKLIFLSLFEAKYDDEDIKTSDILDVSKLRLPKPRSYIILKKIIKKLL